jgi:hemerythrin
MSRIEWSDELCMGVKQIDDQHRELIRIANVLMKAVSLGRDERVLTNVIKRLREYTVFHFNSEESLMEDVRYPERGDHMNEHRRLKQNVKDYQRILYKKEAISPEEIFIFIRGWLLEHILTSDRELARFIHEQAAADHSPGADKDAAPDETTTADGQATEETAAQTATRT